MKRYVQYGCGFSSAKEWINYDASPTLRFERIPLIGKMFTRNERRFPEDVQYGDIIKGLPEKENGCDGVFCSHVLEHLSFHDFKIALKNTYIVLKPGGIFRGVLPDLRGSILNYMENYDKIESPASQFMRETMLGIENRSKGLGGKIKDIYGNSKHLWMWDFKSIKFELENAGFTNIRECKFGDSIDPHFSLVEEENRYWAAVAFECLK
jgi:SAM-dependent methyltransferase